MKTLLLYPPASYVDMPALGLACLKSYLRSKGNENIQVWDSNIAFFDYLLRVENLKRQVSLLSESKDKNDQVRAWLGEMVLAHISDADRILHDKEKYYIPAQFSKAMEYLGFAIDLYTQTHRILQYSFHENGFQLRFRGDASIETFQDVLRLSKDQTETAILRTFFESYIKEQGVKEYDLVGFSVANPDQLMPTLVMAEILKRNRIAKRVVVGGSYITTSRKKICFDEAAYEFIDYFMVFEGEAGLSELCEAIENHRNISEVPNLIYYENGSIHENALQKVSSLHDLPTPDFHGFPIDRYWTPEPVLPVYSTRGCFYDVCEFCNHHENYYGQFRWREPALVIEDLKAHYKRYGARHFFFVDELMIPKRQLEIAQRTSDEKLPFHYYCHSRVEKYLTKDRLRVLEEGGVTLLHLGMESANTRVLELMKKGYDRGEVLRFLSDVTNTKIGIHLNTIKGYPGEQPEEYLETLETALEFTRVGDYIHLYPFIFIDGAPISRNGNPYVKAIDPLPEESLQQFRRVTLSGVKTYTDEENNRVKGLVLRLDQTLPSSLGVLPKKAVWASHLLYVSEYRRRSEDKYLDKKRKDVEVRSDSIEQIMKIQDDLRGEVLKEVCIQDIPSRKMNESEVCLFHSERGVVLFVQRELYELLLTYPDESISLLDVARSIQADARQLRAELYPWIRNGLLRVAVKEPLSKARRKQAHR